MSLTTLRNGGPARTSAQESSVSNARTICGLQRPALVLLGILATSDLAVAADTQEIEPMSRPRIGLVLGGGGARGAAHIGVLRVLEEQRIPIDCLAGTSMGALVGAAYASGMTSREIADLVKGIDWTETFGGAGMRDLQPVPLKSARIVYGNRLEFGLRDKGLLARGGLVASQPIDSLLRSIVSSGRYQKSFDDLPIPFRAVATDASSGEMLVLGEGDLSLAMRASMAVPAAFTPVQLQGRALVDGGLVRNLPVDVVRQMCADVVIASSIVTPDYDTSKPQSALTMVGQMIVIMIRNNEREQLATLTSADVPILVTLPDMTSGEFDKVPAAIPLGEAAARSRTELLARYSMRPEAYAQWRKGLGRDAARGPRYVTVDEVRIGGLDRVNPDVLRHKLTSRPGEPLLEAQIIADVQRLYATGDFDKVDYRIDESSDRPVLEFLPEEKPWGPDYLRFDGGLLSTSGGDTGFVLRMYHDRTWVNYLGGRWSNTLQVGRTALYETSLFQPLEPTQRLFAEPLLRASRALEDVYRGDDRVARYQRTSLAAHFDVGVTLDTRGELRIGVEASRNDYRIDTGDPLLPEFDDVDSVGVTARFILDTRDSAFLPTRGQYVSLRFYDADSALGSDDSYRQATLFAQRVFQVGSDLLYLEVAGGTDLNSDAPAYDLFTLGGVGELAGFEFEELRGQEYAYGRAAYLRKITDLQTLLGQALYAGVSLEAGNMYQRIDGASAGGLILGSSIFLGGRTPLGPLVLTFGVAEGGHKAAYVQIGRPLKER
jgi:NTE family protein